jgi:hypothetical protein
MSLQEFKAMTNNDRKQASLEYIKEQWGKYRNGKWQPIPSTATQTFRDLIEPMRVQEWDGSGRTIPPPPHIKVDSGSGNVPTINLDPIPPTDPPAPPPPSTPKDKVKPPVRTGTRGGATPAPKSPEEQELLKKQMIQKSIMDIVKAEYNSIDDLINELGVNIVSSNVNYYSSKKRPPRIVLSNLDIDVVDRLFKVARLSDMGRETVPAYKKFTLGQLQVVRNKISGRLKQIKLFRSNTNYGQFKAYVDKVVEADNILLELRRKDSNYDSASITLPSNLRGAGKQTKLKGLINGQSRLLIDAPKNYIQGFSTNALQAIRVAKLIIEKGPELIAKSNKPSPDRKTLFKEWFSVSNEWTKFLISNAGKLTSKSSYDLNKIGNGEYFDYVAKLHGLNADDLRRNFYESEMSLIIKIVADYYIITSKDSKSKFKPKTVALIKRIVKAYQMNQAYQVLYFFPSKTLSQLPSNKRSTFQVSLKQLNFYKGQTKTAFDNAEKKLNPNMKTTEELDKDVKKPKQDPNELRRLKSDLNNLGMKLQAPISAYTIQQLEFLKEVGLTNQMSVKDTIIKTKEGKVRGIDIFKNKNRDWVGSAISMKEMYGLQSVVSNDYRDENNRQLLLNKLMAYYAYSPTNQRPPVLLGRFKYLQELSTEYISVYIQRTTKEIKIGFRGTDDAKQLFADVVTILGNNINAEKYADWLTLFDNATGWGLYFNQRWEQLKKILTKYPYENGTGTGYRYSFQGHSLGAVSCLIFNGWIQKYLMSQGAKQFKNIKSSAFNMFAFKNSDLRKQLSTFVLPVPKSKKSSYIWFYQYHIKGDLLSESSARFLPESISNYVEYDYVPRCGGTLMDKITDLIHKSAPYYFGILAPKDKSRATTTIMNAHSMTNFLHDVFLKPEDRCNYNMEIKKELPKWRLKDVLTALASGGLLALGIGLINKNSIERLRLQQYLERTGGFRGRAGAAYSGNVGGPYPEMGSVPRPDRFGNTGNNAVGDGNV